MREINVTYKTTRRRLKLIKKVIKGDIARDLFDFIIEMDKTYIDVKQGKSKKLKIVKTCR